MRKNYCAAISLSWLLVVCSGTVSAADVASDLEFLFQYRSCEITTTDPIYKSGTGAVCGVASSNEYSDSTCPVDEYASCQTPANGIDYWTDITSSPGSYTTEWRNGYASPDDCLDNGRRWIDGVNAGRIGDVPAPDSGTRYALASAEWRGQDTRDPIFGNRVNAKHKCTFIYRVEQAVYRNEPDPACGVLSRKRCKTSYTYNSCQHASFGISGYEKVIRRDAACGIQTDALKYNLVSGDQLFGQNSQRLAEIDRKSKFYCDAERNAANRFYCLQVHRQAIEQLADPQQAELLAALKTKSAEVLRDGVLQGDGAQLYHDVLSLYHSDRSIARRDELANELFFQRARETPTNLSDTDYSRLALTLTRRALRSTPAAGTHPVTIMNPLWSWLTLQSVSQRRVAFRELAELKLLLLATDANHSATLRGAKLIVTEYYVRAAVAQVNQRARDILQLQSLAAQLQSGSDALNRTADAAANTIRSMALPAELEQATLTQLRDANNSERLRAVLADLSASTRREIDTTLGDTERFIAELAQRDRLFAVHLATVHLLRGDYNHAVLAFREAALAYRELPALDTEANQADHSLELFRRNFKQQINDSLVKANAMLQAISAANALDMSVLASLPNDQLGLSFALLDVLQNVQLAMGKNLDGVRLQLMSHFNTNVIEPLRLAAAEEL